MESRYQIKNILEKKIRCLVDNFEDDIHYYRHSNNILEEISLAVSICDDLRVPYKLESNKIIINGGEIRFVRS